MRASPLPYLAWLSVLPALLFAAPPDPNAVTAAERARNLSICRSGLSSCDQSQLTEAEAIAVAVAAYDRNVSNCTAGFNPCDQSRLTRSPPLR